MSQVWRARTPEGTLVALKVPKPALATQPGAASLIRREFRTLERLSDPHIVTALALVELGVTPALITEYLGGGDLVSLAGAHPRHWVGAAKDAASAIEYLHALGIVHRDLKARNILLRAGQDAVVVDFALAAPVGEAAPGGGGTVAYQSLAQRRGASAAVGDDIHAFAALLHELVTGRLPFGPSPSLEALSTPVPRPDTDGLGPDPALDALARLIVEGLMPGAERAPGSIRPFLDVLKSLLAGYE